MTRPRADAPGGNFPRRATPSVSYDAGRFFAAVRRERVNKMIGAEMLKAGYVTVAIVLLMLVLA
jgi:endonuclease YncB( thermonuclease family)